MQQQTNNRTIAKNTLFLYFRMMFTMLVSLYTSRVILDVLGVDDYGIYQTVGGIVMMLSFVNSALSNGTSRFLTFEQGTGNFDKLKRTFSTLLWANVALALGVVLLAETLGLWFVYYKLNIPLEQQDAAVLAYHYSIITCFFSLVLTPYNASIIAHEKMSVYAYMSILDVLVKLGICYLLNIGSVDKLVLYAFLLCLVQILMTLFYVIYCRKHFQETRLQFRVDVPILKEVTGYSSWSLVAASAGALNTQGMTVLISLFFSPAVVSARAIANQVNSAANQFIQNFRTAANPQIVKKYAAKDYEGSKSLLLVSTKYSYYMMLLLAVPICLVAEDLLGVWLKEVPPYTTVFLQLAVITSLFQVFDTSFYTALYAKGRIKENAMISPVLGLFVFPIVYVLFRIGYSPVSLAWAFLALYATLGLVVKPILIIQFVDYHWKDVFSVFIPCIQVTAMAVPIPLFCYAYADFIFPNGWFRFFGLIFISVFLIALVVWFVGIDREIRDKLLYFIREKVRR